jgi:hypothetical protein
MFHFYFNFPLFLLAMEGSRTGLVSLSSLGGGAAKAMPDSDFAALQSQYDALLRDHEELKSYALGTTPFLLVLVIALPQTLTVEVAVSSSRESLARQLEQANSRIAELMTENIEVPTCPLGETFLSSDMGFASSWRPRTKSCGPE